jgi:hypothetical protein
MQNIENSLEYYLTEYISNVTNIINVPSNPIANVIQTNTKINVPTRVNNVK